MSHRDRHQAKQAARTLRRLVLSCACLAVLALGLAPAASAAAGDLDTTFGTGGTALTQVGTNAGSGVSGVVRQSDGKLVVVGTGTDGGGHVLGEIARYNENGTLDSSFGSGGIVQLPTFGSDTLEPSAVALQPTTGDIIVAGSVVNGSPTGTFGAVRLSGTDGSLDSTFAGGSKLASTAIGDSGSDRANAIAVDPSSGNIFVGGTAKVSGVGEFALTEYDAGGAAKTSFGSSGVVLTAISGGDAQINSLAFDSGTGALVAGGQAESGTVAAIERYDTSNGQVDIAFNGGSPVTAQIGGGTSSGAYSVLVALNPIRIVIGGYGEFGSASCLALAQVKWDGTLDMSFGQGGYAHDCVGSSSTANAIAISSDGQIFAAGYSFDGSNTHVALARFTIGGGLDTSFGSSGAVTSDPSGSGNDSQANGLVLDGINPVIAGEATQPPNTVNFALQRFIGEVPPTNSSSPAISGSAIPGQTLTGSPGTWAGATHYVYEWQRCPSSTPPTGCQTEQLDDTSSASDSYTAQSGDVGSHIILEVKGVNSAGYNIAYSGATGLVGTPPSNNVQPSVTLNGSTPWPGETFTGSPGTWSGTQPISYTYEWYRCSTAGQPCDSTPVYTSSSSSYPIQSADVGHRMILVVKASNFAGSATAWEPGYTGIVQSAPPPPGAPKVNAEYEPDPSNWFKTIDFSSGKHPTFTVGDEISADGECDDTGSGISHCEFTDTVNGKTDQVFPAQDSGSGQGFSAQYAFADFHAATPGWHTLSLWANSGDQSQANHTDLVYKVVAPPPPKQQVKKNHGAVGAGPTVLDPLVCEFNPTTCHLLYSGSTPVGEVQDDPSGKTATLFALNTAQVIAAGNGNVIAAGNGNVIAGGSGNVIAGGSGNLFELIYAGRVICAGNGNVIAGGSGNLAAQLISDKGLGIISDKGLGFISNSGLGLISDKGLGLVGDNAQLVMAGGSQLVASNQLAMQLASNAGFASGGIYSALISHDGGSVISHDGGSAADLASVASGKHPRAIQLGAGSSLVARRGDRGHLTVLFSKRGSALIAKVARLNAQRMRHHKRLIKLTLRITTKFKPKTGAPAVTRTRTITITPMPPPKKRK